MTESSPPQPRPANWQTFTLIGADGQITIYRDGAQVPAGADLDDAIAEASAATPPDLAASATDPIDDQAGA